jgi:DNA-binding NtrC family response regulator
MEGAGPSLAAARSSSNSGLLSILGPAGTRPAQGQPGAAQNRSSVAAILVVDDDQDVLDSLSRMVKIFGHRPLSAASAEEALEVLASNHVDLVITDFNMPGIGGLGLIETLARQNHPLLRKILIATGDSGAVDEVEWPEEFPLRILKKPFGVLTLRKAIENVLGETDGESL